MAKELTDEDRAALLEELVRLRQALGEVGTRFTLETRLPGTRKQIGAELIAAWVTLENCRPERLRHSGFAIPAALREELAEVVDDLVTRVLLLRARLE